MASSSDEQRVKTAGIDTKNLPPSAIEALGKLSDAELAALAKARKSLAPLGDFGGVIF